MALPDQSDGLHTETSTRLADKAPSLGELDMRTQTGGGGGNADKVARGVRTPVADGGRGHTQISRVGVGVPLLIRL